MILSGIRDTFDSLVKSGVFLSSDVVCIAYCEVEIAYREEKKREEHKRSMLRALIYGLFQPRHGSQSAKVEIVCFSFCWD
jgi:hypothetical protein